MMVSNRGSVFGLLAWQWKHVLFFTLSGTAAVMLFMLHPSEPQLPTVPIAVFGAALGIFVSFRTNQAYARWWEGRALWGRIVNVSRHVTSQILLYTPADKHEGLVRRHLAWVHALRAALRDQDVLADAEVQSFTDVAALQGERNVPAALLHAQMASLVALDLPPMRMQSLDVSMLALLDAQGGCERIKRTPMPRGYAFIAERLLMTFSCVFPLCIVKDIGYWAIPVNVLVCLGFALISEAGRVLEDPFNMFWNALPLSAISKNIEINLRQRLGDKDLPPNPQVDKNGILM